MVEALEGRVLLSAEALAPAPLDAAGPMQPSTLTEYQRKKGYVDRGDFYWGAQKVPLLRATNEMVVGLKPGVSGERIARRLTAPDGPLARFKSRGDLDDRTWLFSKKGGMSLKAFKQIQAAVEAVPGVRWTSPALITSEGARLWPTDVLFVALADGVDAKTFFQHEFADYQGIGPNHLYAATFRTGGLAAIKQVRRLRERDDVVRASPSFVRVIRPLAAPNDPLYSQLWNFHNTGQNGGTVGADANLEPAWDYTLGSQDIVIAIIDSGVQTGHPDLAANLFTNTNEVPGNGLDDDRNGLVDDVHGWDFVDHDPQAEPATNWDDHGTAVSGVAAAVGGNAIGVTGAAQHVKIMPVRVYKQLSSTRTRKAADLHLLRAIYYAAGLGSQEDGTVIEEWRGADVIVNSWQLDPPFEELNEAYAYASTSGRGGLGVPVFASSGNDGSGSVTYPAKLDSVIAVGATTNRDQRASYSQYGAELDLVAPGGDASAGIVTVDRKATDGYNRARKAAGNYTTLTGASSVVGTSFAAPLAAGVAALMLSLNPELTADQVRTILIGTADKVGGVGYDPVTGFHEQYGYGRVNAGAAVASVSPDTTGPYISGNPWAYYNPADHEQLQTGQRFVLYVPFSERTIWSSEDIAVKSPTDVTIVPDAIYGSGTRLLRIVLPTLTESGTYDLELNRAGFHDQAGNAWGTGTQIIGLPLELTPVAAPTTLDAAGPAQAPTLTEYQRKKGYVDKGDFYYYFDEKIPMLRVTNEMIVGIKQGASPGRLVSRLTGPGGPLDSFRKYAQDFDGAIRFIRKGGLGEKRFNELRRAVARVPGVAWTSPAFLVDGSKILITNRINIRLEADVDVEGFFATHALSSYKRIGPQNQYSVTLSDRGGLQAMRLANELHPLPEVRWAEPSSYFRLEFYAVPNDPLFDYQWNLSNTGQSGGRSGRTLLWKAHGTSPWEATR